MSRACLLPPCLLSGLAAALVGDGVRAADPTFLRGINLNGPALVIDGRLWEGEATTNVVIRGGSFENQAVPLKPATDAARARMLRSSRWGNAVRVELKGLAEGTYQVVLYVWEDNHSEQFDLLVNDQPVLESFHSGAAGAWKKLGPWPATSRDGQLTVSARAPSHGAANFSGLELWSGTGPLPEAPQPRFAENPTPEQTEFFERRIRPVLAEHCYECHSATATKLKGGLLLDSRAGLRRGGDTGPVVTPGQPEASLLIQAVRHADPELAMPPKRKLTDAQIADLTVWVQDGLPDPRTTDTVAAEQSRKAIDWPKAREWWSFRPLARPAAPAVQRTDWPASDLDRFILARLESQGLSPAPDAEPRTLIRRVTFDLTGLPPTPAEVEAFLADTAPDAWARLVDRLLASPAYGERWGRHWLDVVRYADTAGDNSDFPIPQQYRYRDWVIRAFNRDLPYDQFIREQLAGDLLPGGSDAEVLERVVATGYLANARRFGSRVDDYPQHLTIEDTIDNLGRTFLGLTVNCARCHDHKFDPVTAADYYALYGIFQSTRYPWPGIELEQRQRDLVPLVGREQRAAAERARIEREAEQRRLEKDVQRLKEALKQVAAPEQEQAKAKVAEAERIAREFRDQPLPFEYAYAVAEGTKFGDATIQLKGDPAKPGPVVPRRFLEVLHGEPVQEADRTSGRRQLADWIADARNPLTARVWVNRVWQHHFGRGLVPTPNDFGRQGKPPTHPELFDWLASGFIADGWSVKALHRRILLSRTYRLAGERGAALATADPNGVLWGAFPRRRLEAEALRDTLLVLGGNLDPAPAGPHPFPPARDWKFTQHNPFKAVYASRHRSVYLMTQRIQRHPYLAIFDGADPAASTPARTTSTTPLQALFLLNDPFVHEQSERFAARLQTLEGEEAGRIGQAYQLALSRPATSLELEQARSFLSEVRRALSQSGRPTDAVETEAWQALVRVLFRLNEFVYVD